jgi:hypothetical protein
MHSVQNRNTRCGSVAQTSRSSALIKYTPTGVVTSDRGGEGLKVISNLPLERNGKERVGHRGEERVRRNWGRLIMKK